MTIWIDIKYMLRQLTNKPMFTLISVLVVAFGLGLTVYTYTLLTQIVFKPLTLQGTAPLVAIEGEFREKHGRGQRADPYHLNHIGAESKLIERMSLYRTGSTILSDLDNMTGSKKLHASYSQWNLFEVAGVQPQLGRGFSPADQEVGADPVVVISHAVWAKYFGQNPDILGTSIRVNGTPKQIIGVMPAGFSFPAVAQIWAPLVITQIQTSAPSDAYSASLNGVARLKNGVSLSQLRSEVDSLLAEHFQLLPQEFAWRTSSPGGYIRVFPFKYTDDSIAQKSSIFIALFLVVVLILLLTCINVGNLLLARVNERIKEVAIRIALGISKERLVIQMLWESVFICGVGGVLAWILAAIGVQVTNEVLNGIFALSEARPFWWHIKLESDAVVVLVVTLIFMVIATGLLPAWRALTGDMNAILRDGTRGALGKINGRINKSIVITEIALSSVVLMIASILLYTSFNAQNADYGVDTNNRITAQILLPTSVYPTNPRTKRNDFYYQLKGNLEQSPNIHSVAYFTSLPGTGGGSSHFEILGKEALVYNENPLWNFEVVSRGAWDTVAMKIIAGRDFDERDLDSGESPVIINDSMARALFPLGDALGQRVRTVDEGDWHTEWRTIVGIVSDSVHGPTMQATSAWHTGYGLMDLRSWTMELVVHYSGSEAQAMATLHKAVADMDPEVTLDQVQSYEQLIAQPMRLIDAINTIFLWCGLVALVLAATGIYAVSANSISLRSQEIATRRALGASNGHVVRFLLKEAGLQLTAGLVVGMSISIWLIYRISQSMLIGGGGFAIGLVGVPILISVMVLIATYIPSKKITSYEPSEGLRQV
ncbi:ABC transporter permease [Pseudoalteromonas luteoviolacea]|uniref:ABC transporter permease n=1 Tax=Pseudoalteromonas luteoviolacea TaxID=43657 RepID=UPI001B38B6EE|nr:ABC transporter permease [Pseudoalteromonas luteoviolacea]MBQ4811548.1 ABC transporter permease [Pseudoalteromonas luteoviolacea]